MGVDARGEKGGSCAGPGREAMREYPGPGPRFTVTPGCRRQPTRNAHGRAGAGRRAKPRRSAVAEASVGACAWQWPGASAICAWTGSPTRLRIRRSTGGSQGRSSNRRIFPQFRLQMLRRDPRGPCSEATTSPRPWGDSDVGAGIADVQRHLHRRGSRRPSGVRSAPQAAGPAATAGQCAVFGITCDILAVPGQRPSGPAGGASRRPVATAARARRAGARENVSRPRCSAGLLGVRWAGLKPADRRGDTAQPSGLHGWAAPNSGRAIGRPA